MPMLKAVDKGALDCVIKARTMAAAQRALDTTDQPDWEYFNNGRTFTSDNDVCSR